MTAPILFDTLVQLSQRLPERFTYDAEALYGEGDVILRSAEGSISYADSCMYVGGDTLFLMWLELVLRREIQECGWFWSVHCYPTFSGGCEYRAEIGSNDAPADTPAHALALAILEALP